MQGRELFEYEKTYDRITSLTKGEYESCTFSNCDLGSFDLSGFRFLDCTFSDCNLSLAKLSKTSLQDLQFKNCKMLGLRFDLCDQFAISFTFDGCQLNHSSFYKLKIKKTVFKNSQLEETDFTEADLSNATFDNCNLLKAHFEQTVIEKADFRTSYNYSIDPNINRLKKAKFSLDGIAGLLDKYDIVIEK